MRQPSGKTGSLRPSQDRAKREPSSLILNPLSLVLNSAMHHGSDDPARPSVSRYQTALRSHSPYGRTRPSTPAGVEGRATGIFIALARLEDRLFSNNTRPLNPGQFATRIRNHPVPAQQMHGFPSLILEDHSISPEMLRVARR